MGSLYFDLSSYFNVEVNDNVNFSGVRSLDDVILRAGVSFDGNLELTSFNSFSLNFDLAYSKYLNNPELDSSNSFLDLSDDSEFAFKVLVGSFEISLYDRLGFTADPTDSVVVDPDSNVVDFNILQYARFNRSGFNSPKLASYLQF